MQNRFRLAIYDVLESKGISRDNCINWARELAEKVNEIHEAAQQGVHPTLLQERQKPPPLTQPLGVQRGKNVAP